MDKCEYFFLNTTASSATPSVVNTTYLSNIQIGSMNYLLNPVFDVASNTCLMSAPTTAAPVCIHAPAVNGLCGPQVSSSYPFVLGTTCRDNSGACYGCYWGSANKSAPASNNGYNLNWKLNGGTCQPWLSQCP